MAHRIRTGLTAAQGRKFAFTVGGAFFVFAAITWWRQHPTMMTVFLSLGGAFSLGGLVAPTMMGPVEKAWMGLAHLISKVTTPIFMGIVYFVVMMPIGYLRRMSAGKMGAPKDPALTNWVPHTPAVARRESMERQF